MNAPMPEGTIDRRESDARPAAIERTLSDLWRERAARGQGGARSRLATLIAVCDDDDTANLASREIAVLNASRPVRSIVVALNQRAGEAAADAALHCQGAAERGVCYEEITLRVPGEATRALPSLLAPLTVPDLPVYVWFPGDLALDDALYERLFDVADRVVTDSHSFTDPIASFRRLNAWVRSHRDDCVFTEMTWTRMGTWREAVGKLFDPSDSRAFLAHIEGVSISSAHGAGMPSDRSLLMMGWLASKLGWRPMHLDRDDTYVAHYATAGGEVPVSMLEGPPAARGHLLDIRIECPDVSFHVERVHGDPSGAIRSYIVCSGEEGQRPAYNPLHWQLNELLCNALEIRSPFTDWEDALASLAALEG